MRMLLYEGCRKLEAVLESKYVPQIGSKLSIEGRIYKIIDVKDIASRAWTTWTINGPGLYLEETTW